MLCLLSSAHLSVVNFFRTSNNYKNTTKKSPWKRERGLERKLNIQQWTVWELCEGRKDKTGCQGTVGTNQIGVYNQRMKCDRQKECHLFPQLKAEPFTTLCGYCKASKLVPNIPTPPEVNNVGVVWSLRIPFTFHHTQGPAAGTWEVTCRNLHWSTRLEGNCYTKILSAYHHSHRVGMWRQRITVQ